MKKKLIKLLLQIIILISLTNVSYGKGALDINVTIQPVGTTKKYNHGNSLLLDAGVMNAQSASGELLLANVTVTMVTKDTTDGTSEAPGIEGDFSLPFKLSLLEMDRNIKLYNLVKYKNGNEADMTLNMKKITILDKQIFPSTVTGDTYLFIANQQEADQAAGKNAIALKSLTYSFELWLNITGANVGDIIRKDVQAKDPTAIGNIQDIIKEQFQSSI